MSSITQTIPNYLNGISQQPDELKPPGYVTVANNVLPDVTEGLVKRPGSKLMSKITPATTSSTWFDYYRDENEHYIGQIINQNGDVNIWNCKDGTEKAVTFNANYETFQGQHYTRTAAGLVTATTKVSTGDGSGASREHGLSVGEAMWWGLEVVKVISVISPTQFQVQTSTLNNAVTATNGYYITGYLITPDPDDIQTLTLNDYTYICNRSKPVKLSTETTPVRPYEAFVDLKKVAYARQYAINLFDDTSTTPVSTATRVSAELINGGVDSLLPNVGTKIYSINGIPEVQTINTSIIGTGTSTDGWYQISDGTTTIEKNFDLGSNNLERTEKLAEGFRNHSDYHKLKFTIGTIAEKDDIIDEVNYGTEFRLVFKEGGAQTLATLKRLDASGGTPTHSYTVTKVSNTGVNSSDNNKENLYFRVTVTGQAVPHQKDETPKYYGRYQTVIDLLHGGEGWSTTDVIEVGFKGCSIQVKIDSISTAKVQANLGLIRPIPTSFDAKTTVTSESIIGDIRQEILDKYTGTYEQKQLNSVEVYEITKAAHGLTTGDKVDIEFLTSSGGAQSYISNGVVTRIDADKFSVPGTDTNVTGTCAIDFTNPNLLQIGSGLYIKRANNKFKISTPSNDILNVLSTEIEDVADLPAQCKHGYVVKIKNSEADEDDYYVKFIGSLALKPWSTSNVYAVGDEVINNGRKYVCDQAGTSASSGDGPTGTGADIADNGARWDYAEINENTDYLNGDGIWEECLAPEQQFRFDVNTMPHQLIRQANGNFEIKSIPIADQSLDSNLPQWEDAQVGTTDINGTNPQPSFVGKTINNMLFWRNRLVMLSDENVIMSRPGDFFNFWYKSAIAYTDPDPIDISCSSEYPAIIYSGIQTNAGLVLFTENQQFLVTTDSDVLSTRTAKISSLSAYNFNKQTNPISLGTTIAFLDNAGKYNRLWEMSTVFREGEPIVVEQSKVVSKLIDTSLDLTAISRENQVLFLSKQGSNKLFVFQYQTSGDKRIQQAWVTWELHGEIQHMALFDDALFAIIKDKDVYSIQRIALKTLSDSIEITDDRGTTSDTSDDLAYRVYLDNGTVIKAAQLGYSSTTGRTGFTIPTNFDATSANKIVIFCHSAGDDNGRYTDQTTIVGSGDDANIEFNGNWTGQDLTVGYLYDMEVQLPTIYRQLASGDSFKADIHKSLVVHRIKLSLGPSGLYTTTLSRLGKTDFTTIHESPLADQYGANKVSVNNILKETVPIYERNTNLTITIKSTHPTPATLYSMTWEGDYTDKFYQSV